MWKMGTFNDPWNLQLFFVGEDFLQYITTYDFQFDGRGHWQITNSSKLGHFPRMINDLVQCEAPQL